jgi:hypothetical protein
MYVCINTENNLTNIIFYNIFIGGLLILEDWNDLQKLAAAICG